MGNTSGSLSIPEINFTPTFSETTRDSSYSTNLVVSGTSELKKATCLLEKIDDMSYSSSLDCSLLKPTFSNLTKDGLYRLSVSAIFMTGQTSSVSKNFIRDTAPPIVTFNMTPATNSGSSTASFVFSISESMSGLASSQCQIDSTPKVDCKDTYTMGNLSAGSHTFIITTVDKAGNSTTKNFLWTVELSAPTLNFSQFPNSLTNSTSAEFSFSSSQTGQFECSLDGSSFTSCSNPSLLSASKALANLSPNQTHKFSIRLVSASTGKTSSEISYSWIVDTLAPSVPVISSDLQSITKIRNGNVSFSASDINGIQYYECSTDNVTFSRCSSPIAVSFNEGNQKYYVKATDAAGNSSSSGSYSILVDTIAPTISWASTLPTSTTNTSASFLMSASDTGSGILKIQCSLDGSSFSDCTSPLSVSVSVGSHSLQVIAYDKANNPSNLLVANWTVITPTTTTSPSNSSSLLSSTNLLNTSLKMADFIVSLQNSDGAIKDSVDSSICNEDSNMEYALLGLAAAYKASQNSKYLNAFEKGLDWLAARQEMTDITWKGSWYYAYSCTSPYSPVAVSPGANITNVRGVDATGSLFVYLLYIHQKISGKSNYVNKYLNNAKEALNFLMNKNMGTDGFFNSSFQLISGNWQLFKYQYTADQVDVYLGFKAGSQLFDIATNLIYSTISTNLYSKIPTTFYDATKARYGDGKTNGSTTLDFTNSFNTEFAQGYTAWVISGTQSVNAYNWLKNNQQTDGSIVGYVGDPSYSLAVATMILAGNSLGQTVPDSAYTYLLGSSAFNSNSGGVKDSKLDAIEYTNVTSFAILALLKQKPFEW